MCAKPDARYRAFFECFNEGKYFEAHEVLEGLWLECRDERRDFYKGLIQLAAVFVKLQQDKLAPARRLAERAASNLAPYAPQFEGFAVAHATGLLDDVCCGKNPLAKQAPPRLVLETP